MIQKFRVIFHLFPGHAIKKRQSEEILSRIGFDWNPYDGTYRRFFSLSCLFYESNIVVKVHATEHPFPEYFLVLFFNFISALQRDITAMVDMEENNALGGRGRVKDEASSNKCARVATSGKRSFKFFFKFL